MTHIIKAEIGLKCPQAALRSLASLQEKTHFALLFFFCHPNVWSSKRGSVCEERHSIPALKPIIFLSIVFLRHTELISLIIE